MKAWELIADPKRWTQGWFARNASGHQVASCADDAACWCFFGAVYRTYRDAVPVAHQISRRYFDKFDVDAQADNDRPGMTASLMSERLRIVEEEVLAELTAKEVG